MKACSGALRAAGRGLDTDGADSANLHPTPPPSVSGRASSPCLTLIALKGVQGISSGVEASVSA